MGARTAVGLDEARSTPLAGELRARLDEAKRRPRAALHRFHRWYGKLVPAIPAAAIEAFTRPGDLVVDPFCGSGTTLLEARLAGRRAWGCDLHPLAVAVSTVKTRAIPAARLRESIHAGLARFDADPGDGWRDEVPPLPNLAHFFPDAVARDLVRLLRAARQEPDERAREWLRVAISAISRDVSNADTRHVFAGVSRRMRGLIDAGWRADVRARFARAAADRCSAAAALESAPAAEEPVVVEGAAARVGDAIAGRAALVVTNPPYASSIRYAETLKLETAWMGWSATRAERQALDASLLGTERVTPAPGAAPEPRGAGARAAVADLRSRGELRAALVVAWFLDGLDAALGAAARAVRPGGHVVLKLAPSRLRGTVVPTPEAAVESLESHGLELVAALDDAYDARSRSLTLARNWYSGRIDADLLLAFRRGA